MGSPSSLRAQARPPNPAPTITTRARVSAIGQDAELGVGEPQRGLDGVRRTGAGKHEAEVAIALGQGNERLSRWYRDHQPLDARYRFRLPLTLNGAQPSALPNRQHHHAGRGPLALVGRHRQAGSMPPGPPPDRRTGPRTPRSSPAPSPP